MKANDMYGWGAVALFLGPLLAAAAIPVLKWFMQDSNRILGLMAIIGIVYWWLHR